MPTLEWIGKDKVVNHHQEVPFRMIALETVAQYTRLSIATKLRIGRQDI